MGDGQGQEQPRKGDNQATEEQVPAQVKEAEEKEKGVEPEKEKEMETQDDIKEDSAFEVIQEMSQKTSIYPTLPTEEQTRLWKTNPRKPEKKEGKETTEKLASHPKKNQPANPNKKLQHVSFLQGDTQQGGGAGDEEAPGGQGGGKQLGLPQAEDR